MNDFSKRYLSSIGGACCAEFATYPLDLAKTRLQLQGERNVQHGRKQGLFAVCKEVVLKEGMSKLYFGMSPAIYRHIPYSGIRMCGYQALRPHLGERPSLISTAVLGMSCGAFAQIVSNPFDLIKVKMQNEGKRRLQGMAPTVEKLQFSAFFKSTLRAGGWRAFMAGSIPNAQRAALVNLGDLTAYDTSKNTFLRLGMNDSYFTYFLASMSAGLVSAVLGTPADVIKTRIMNQPLDKNGKGFYYKGSIDCLSQAIKNEGFFSLYKGFLPCWLRMGPWSLTFWISFETICSVSGIKSV